MVAHYVIERSEAFETASSFLRANAAVVRLAGPVHDTSLSWRGGEIEVSGDSGSARLTVNVSGTAGEQQAYVELRKRGNWEVTFAQLLPASGPTVLLKEGP